MSGICGEVEHRYMGRKHVPHCRTCVCKENTDIPTRLKITSPRMNKFRYRCSPRKTRDCCGACHLSSSDDECVTREYYQEKCSISPPSKTERNLRSDHKFSTLETWFKRFDFDGNGLLDVYELKSLLNHLGIKCEQEYVKELIDKADRDRDGMLSFADFLYMWSQAAQEEIDLYDVVKEHDLYPDILPPPKNHMRRNIKKAHLRNYEPRRECSCCESRPKWTDEESRKRRELEMETKTSLSPTRCSDKIPLLSCHR